MRFGTCTWVFGDEPLESIAQRAAAVGLDGVELFGDVALDPRAVRAVFENRRLEIFSLTPANVDLCHPDLSTRESALEYYIRLTDFAAELSAPIVSCHGFVGRVRALDSQPAELGWFSDAVSQIAARAASSGIRVAIELLNRYESHLLNTVAEGLAFCRNLGAANVGLVADAYHMNIEEENLEDAILRAGDRLFLFHAADSNRQALGRGHTDWRAVARALHTLPYRGDIVFECTAPGPDPFRAVKNSDSPNQVEEFHRESLATMKRFWESETRLYKTPRQQ